MLATNPWENLLRGGRLGAHIVAYHGVVLAWVVDQILVVRAPLYSKYFLPLGHNSINISS